MGISNVSHMSCIIMILKKLKWLPNVTSKQAQRDHILDVSEFND